VVSAIRGGAVILAVGMAMAACARSHVRPAPFRARPDSVAQGDLRGPFSGRVVDVGTERPVAGALVYASWTVQGGYGLTAPQGFHEHVTSTDADGRYQVPRLAARWAKGSRLADFSLVIYKRGYVAYRSNRRFSDLGPRLDFAQARHEVGLDRWRPEMSHAKHLRYIGGGAAIASLTSWEAEEAARELAGGTLVGRQRLTSDPFAAGGDGGVAAAVVAARLLGKADVAAVTGFEGDFETGPLGDEPDTAQYSSFHLRALDRPESFDVALRLWKLPPSEAQQRYGTLMDSLPTADERNEIGDRSLRAAEGQIRGVAFLDGKRGAVVLLTCGIAQCRTPEDAVAIARRIYEKLDDVWPMGGAR